MQHKIENQKHYITPYPQPDNAQAATATTFPDRLDGFVLQNRLGGGTASVFSIINHATQQELVLKYGAHEDAAKIEMLCHTVYQALKIQVPSMRVYHTLPTELALSLGLQNPCGMFQVSEFVKEISPAKKHNIANAARRDFAAHVLLGNIDVAKCDNFIAAKNGVHLIDAGANFIFRAKGAVRSEDPGIPAEVDSLRDKKMNAAGCEWFAGLSEAEIAAQVTILMQQRKQMEAAVWHASSQLQLPEELRNRFLEYLSDRLDYLVRRFCHGAEAHAKQDKKAYPASTAAGILTYAIINNEPHILLSKRARHEWWDNFGGKSEDGDVYLLDTAQREVAEESSRLLNYSNAELSHSPSHDLVTGSGKQQFIYRLYLCQHDEIKTDDLQDAEHSAHQWVPVTAVLAALGSNERVQLENQSTVVIHHGVDQLPIYPPLYQMLMQPPVYHNLQKLAASATLSRTHTLGFADDRSAPQLDYCPLVTPVQKREQISETLQHKSRMLRELKKINQPVVEADSDSQSAARPLSQSEVHLQAILGKAYRENNPAANVRTFVEKYYRLFGIANDNDQKERLISHAGMMLESEISGSADHTYFYHGCNDQVAFAYDVYTALYQALQADDQWTALRVDNEHFKSFANINEFVAHYSGNGKNAIDNNGEHYNDCALSTNVFLFGNHNIDTSNSLYYLVTNHVARKIDLEALFANLLQPFHVTKDDIKQLLQVFKRYREGRGGTLYQIAMPHEQARLMAYPASSGGVMNKFEGSADLISILQALRTRDLQDKKTVEYIKNLQARLMVPPHQRLQVKALHWQDHAAVQQDYQRSLQQSVAAILNMMLNHYGAFHDAHRKTALIAVLPSVLAANQLSLTATINDAVLARAIVTNDEAVVRAIMLRFPEFREKSILLPRGYIRGNYLEQSVDVRLPVLEMMYNCSSLSFELMAECYGAEKIWQMAKNNIQCEFELVNFIARLPLAKRLVYALQNKKKILYRETFIRLMQVLPPADCLAAAMELWRPEFEGETLAMILCFLPEAERLTYVMNLGKIKYDINSLCAVVGKLPEADRTAYAKSQISNVYQYNGGCLPAILRVLPQSDRFELATYYLANTHNVTVLVEVLQILPLDHQLEFAKRCLASVRDGQQLSEVLQCLPAENQQQGSLRLMYALEYGKYIMDVDELAAVLRALPELERQAYARVYCKKIYAPDALLMILQVLCESERSSFVEYYSGQIANGRELTVALSALLPDQRVEFANKSSSYILDGMELAIVVAVLPLDSRFSFAVAHGLKINNSREFAALLKHLPVHLRPAFMKVHAVKISDSLDVELIAAQLEGPDLVAFLLQHRALLLSWREFKIALRKLPEEQALVFITAGEGSLPADVNLIELLQFLPQDRRLEFTSARPQLVRKTQVLKGILDLLPAEQRRDCLIANRACLHGIDDWSAAIAKCPEEQALEIVKLYQQHFLNTNCELSILLHVLPVAERVQFALEQQRLIDFTGRNGLVLSAIPQEDRFDFMASLYDKFDANSHYTGLAFMLPKEQRLKFAETFHLKITCEETIKELMGMLPDDDRLAFVMSHHARITGLFPLESWLMDLPLASQKLAFVRAHMDKVNGWRDIEMLIRKFPVEHHAEFIRAYQSKIRDVAELGRVTGILNGKSVELLAEVLACCHDLITNLTSMEYILGTLPAEMRKAFAFKYRDMIQDAFYLNKVLYYLPEAERLAFIGEGKFEIHSNIIFCEIVKRLPQDQRLCFVLSRPQTITALNNLLDVMYLLPEESRVILMNEHLDLLDNKIARSRAYRLLPEPPQSHVAVAGLFRRVGAKRNDNQQQVSNTRDNGKCVVM